MVSNIAFIVFYTRFLQINFHFILEFLALIEYKNEIEFDLENPSDLSIIRFRSAFAKLQKMFPEDIPND